MYFQMVPVSSIFLSTPSARRATRCKDRGRAGVHISIHALREEGDSRLSATISWQSGFLSTPSARRATITDHSAYLAGAIFLSTPSARRATKENMRAGRYGEFLSTPSARRATTDHSAYLAGAIFLSTPSARRATDEPISLILHMVYFYPRPPRGGRQQKQRQNLYFQTNYTTFCTNLEEP